MQCLNIKRNHGDTSASSGLWGNHKTDSLVSSINKLQKKKNKQKKGKGEEPYQLIKMRSISTTCKYGLYLDSDSNNCKKGERETDRHTAEEI